MIQMHAHDIVTYTRCRRKDYYSRIRGYEVPTLGSKVEVGSMFHAGLSAVYRAGVEAGAMPNFEDVIAKFVADKWIEEQVQIRVDDEEKAVDMLNYYWQHVGFMETAVIKKVLAVEDELKLVIPELDVEITCRPDFVFERLDGRTILRDHKTKDALPSDYSWFDMDPQMMIYQLVCRQYGWTPATVQHNLVRREVPPGFGHRPEYNEGIDKNGKPYRRKSTGSTEPTDYFRIFEFTKGEATLAAYEKEIFSTVEEMITAPESLHKRRSVSSMCTYCPFFVICNRELAGETVTDDEASLLFSQSQYLSVS